MDLTGPGVTLERITPALAGRIIARDEQPGDAWHPDYPYVDELVPLQTLADATDPDERFTLYLLRRRTDGLAVGGLGYFGPPDDDGLVDIGYGLVADARGQGLASEAVRLAVDAARRWGVRTVAADTEVTNVASQQVLLRTGFVEVRRNDANVFYERALRD